MSKDRKPTGRMLAGELGSFVKYQKVDLKRLGEAKTPLEAYEVLEALVGRTERLAGRYRSVMTSVAYEVLEGSK